MDLSGWKKKREGIIMKILLVDDQERILRAMEKLVDWERL